MATYLLTWNPGNTDSWPKYHHDLRRFRRIGHLDIEWGCGNTRKISAGDRLFLLCQGVEPRGIVAAGYAVAPPALVRKRGRSSSTARAVKLNFGQLLDIDSAPVMEVSQIKAGPLSDVNWSTQRSGIALSDHAARALERRWQAHLASLEIANEPLPEEINSSIRLYEGEKKRITVNAYERNPEARRKCIEYHGANCKVCNFDFEDVYGEHGKGFIHVHHTIPLASIRKGYTVDPHKDLVPVCPNCHAMLHRGDKTLTVKQLRRMLNVT